VSIYVRWVIGEYQCTVGVYAQETCMVIAAAARVCVAAWAFRYIGEAQTSELCDMRREA
jgi:hypothetical protein